MSSTDTPEGMSSNRPYLLRAVYDWVCDNNLTPYLLVDATREGVRVPPHVVKDGQVVLNVAMRAVANLDLGNDRVSFSARFSGVSQNIYIPVTAVLAIYAQENGQGMMFPAGDEDAAAASAPSESGASKPSASGPKAVETEIGDPEDSPSSTEGDDKPRRGAPHLRVIK